MAIKLIVGLGNPGGAYQAHRHNVGFWFVEAVADLCAENIAQNFKKESKFLARVAKVTISDCSVLLIEPDTYMNRSGQSVQKVAQFYKIRADEILIVHDDLDLNPSVVKLKFGGGHGGHNGLRDTIQALQSADFHRLRIGIGHPGDKSKVADFVLCAAPKSEAALIHQAIARALDEIVPIVRGDSAMAMQNLHSKPA